MQNLVFWDQFVNKNFHLVLTDLQRKHPDRGNVFLN